MPTASSPYRLRCVKILDVKDETDDIKTFRYADPTPTSPGQFMMVWLPGKGEVPMAASFVEETKGITVRRVGPTTNALHALKPGERLWVRGPLGNGYRLRGKSLLVVAGGTGISSLAPMVENAIRDGSRVKAVVGGRTARQVYMVERLERARAEVTLSTDDGSAGASGLASDVAERLMKKERFDDVLACGPEPMMRKVVEAARRTGVQHQVSLERYMKCGIGICDSCAVGGLHPCRDGPVFTEKELASCDEFGRLRKDAAGVNVAIK